MTYAGSGCYVPSHEGTDGDEIVGRLPENSKNSFVPQRGCRVAVELATPIPEGVTDFEPDSILGNHACQSAGGYKDFTWKFLC